MAIDSVSFIFWLLPVFLFLFILFKEKYRKPLILCVSLFVCSWGSLKSLILLLGFIIFNWAFGKLITDKRSNLCIAVGFDLAFLCMFKFLDVTETLPIGISYYVLSGISYCIDIYRSDVDPHQSLYNTAFYLSFFPKLIMGPFVKYKDFEAQIDSPVINSQNVSDGMFRFSIGLAKKLAIAGSLAEMTERCWEDAPFSTASAWLGLIGFTLQLYYDFSGYSDMAVGLSKICGFEISENFDYPLESASIKEFWSRWHISLGEWFKDYVYIPLGGNRLGRKKTVLNLFIVWMLTGLWHGIGLNYIAWGMCLFAFICIEKFGSDIIAKLPRIAGIIITNVIILLSWVFFNSKGLGNAFDYFGYLFGKSVELRDAISSLYFSRFFPIILCSIIGTTSFPKECAKNLFSGEETLTLIFKCIFVIALLSMSTASIVVNGYTPFLYTGF